MMLKTWYGHLEYQVIRFELSNIPASLQNYINRFFLEKLDIFVIIYLNNSMIYIENPGKVNVNTIFWGLD